MSVQNMIAIGGVSMTRYERSETVDAGGALVKGYTAQLDLVVVYLQPAQPGESIVNGVIRQTTNHTGYCAIGTTVLISDRLLYDSKTYEITGMRSPDMLASPHNLAYQILTLVEIEGET